MTKRDAILDGAKAAVGFHRQLGTRKRVEETGGSVDVFGALLATDAVLLFRPLTGLLGACIPGPRRPARSAWRSPRLSE